MAFPLHDIKFSDRQKPYESDITVHYVHSVPPESRQWTLPYRCVSIDPGVVNFAMRIEERCIDGRVVPLHFSNVRLIAPDAKATDSDQWSVKFGNLIRHLSQYDDLFLTCHHILFERQLPKNHRALLVQNHAMAYFMNLLRDKGMLADIVEVAPTLKGRMLGSPYRCTKPELKKWSVQQATKMLTYYNDQASLQIIRQSTKRDDLADTITQAAAFYKLKKLVPDCSYEFEELDLTPAPEFDIIEDAVVVRSKCKLFP